MLYCAWLKVKSSKSKFKVKDKVQSSHSLIHLSTYILHLTFTLILMLMIS